MQNAAGRAAKRTAGRSGRAAATGCNRKQPAHQALSCRLMHASNSTNTNTCRQPAGCASTMHACVRVARSTAKHSGAGTDGILSLPTNHSQPPPPPACGAGALPGPWRVRDVHPRTTNPAIGPGRETAAGSRTGEPGNLMPGHMNNVESSSPARVYLHGTYLHVTYLHVSRGWVGWALACTSSVPNPESTSPCCTRHCTTCMAAMGGGHVHQHRAKLFRRCTGAFDHHAACLDTGTWPQTGLAA